MILYLDASAAVKKYVDEAGTAEVRSILVDAESLGTSIICIAEIIAALARGVRMGQISAAQAEAGRSGLAADWPHFARIEVTEDLVGRACRLVWAHALRGCDSIHLASAQAWQEELGAPVTFVAFDQQLWHAAELEGLERYPPDLPELLARWRTRKPFRG